MLLLNIKGPVCRFERLRFSFIFCRFFFHFILIHSVNVSHITSQLSFLVLFNLSYIHINIYIYMFSYHCLHNIQKCVLLLIYCCHHWSSWLFSSLPYFYNIKYGVGQAMYSFSNYSFRGKYDFSLTTVSFWHADNVTQITQAHSQTYGGFEIDRMR